jgi:hypothetical protein
MKETKLNELIIPYETGIPKLAKEKGFTDECLAFYSGNPHDVNYKWELNFCRNSWHTHKNNTTAIIAPTYEQLKNWLREQHNINIMYGVCGSPTKILGYKWWVQVGMNEDCFQTKMIKDYYEGMTEAIKEALKLI